MDMKKVSGILRVKNDAMFIPDCIESCIDALDELIIVYNDCSDDSPSIIEKMRERYPEKIKVFEYPYKVYGAGLTKEEYDYVCSLPDDSPHLLCNYYNFALSKVTSEYAMKIDADQYYFPDVLRKWCDIARNDDIKTDGCRFFGMLFHYFFLAYRVLSIKLNKRIRLLPSWLAKSMKRHYESYSIAQLKKGKACLSFSGVNLVKTEKWYVPLGKITPEINILPPFNGETDHLLFKVDKEKTYYRKFMMSYYNLLSNSSYSLIEEFVHPYKVMFAGFCWYHMNALRPAYAPKYQMAIKKHPMSFLPLSELPTTRLNSIEKATDNRVFTLFQRLLFSYIFESDKYNLENHKTQITEKQKKDL